ncbi:hypothetical protein BDV3_001380 [Batrachochytrium dendrobatidis]
MTSLNGSIKVLPQTHFLACSDRRLPLIIRMVNTNAPFNLQLQTATHTCSTALSIVSRSQHTTAQACSVHQSPIELYTHLVEAGKLREDAHQRQSVAKLEELYRRIEHYDPPKLPLPEKVKQHVKLNVGDDSGKENIKSPDFAWINKNEKTIFGTIKELFDQKQTVSRAIRGPNGLYIYGDVGTGKTMLMDLFYQTVPTPLKNRVHFHAFMQDVHKRIHKLRVHEGITSDPLPLIASELASEAWLLCFDEMQVTDIGDAMILRRLFSELFDRGVVMVTTSNRPPDDLYQNGIQRQSFLPAIDLLKNRCQVHSLNSGIDYRKQDHNRYQVYLSPLNIETDDIIRRLFNQLRGGTKVEAKEISFWGRTLLIKESAGRVAKVSFQQLCGEPHSAADYLELVKHFDIILLTDVPAMTLAHRNEARRFITLLDAMYENRIKLVATMESNLSELFLDKINPHAHQIIADTHRLLMDDLKLSTEQATSSLFTGAEEVFAFQRAISRLTEMQTHGWVGDDLAHALEKVL